MSALLFSWITASAQMLDVREDGVYSNILQQHRPFDVYLPDEFAKDPNQRYETIYVLDGDWNVQIVVNVVDFMRRTGVIPPVIVVGVPNVEGEHGNSRDHDFTPSAVADNRQSGGAAEFLSFLKTELVPYIDSHYPTNQVHLIHGHSFGGLFLMYALIYEPTLFDGYLILDPSLYWDSHRLDVIVDEKLSGIPDKGKAIYIAGRSGHAFDDMGLSTVETIFKHKAPPALHWQITAYPEESHDSLKLKATYDALKFAYQGYTTEPIDFLPSGGILIRGKPISVVLDGAAERLDRLNLHYSTDGTVPTTASPRIDGPMEIANPEKTAIKLLSNRGIFDRVIPLHFQNGQALAPSRSDRREMAAWHVAFYPADAWRIFNRSRAFKVFATGRQLRFVDAGRESFAGIVERSLDIPADGYYVFGLRSNDKVRLMVDGRLLIENDRAGGHSRPAAIVIPLQRGVYRVRLEFVRAIKDSDLDMAVFRCKDGEPDWRRNRLFTVSSRE